MVALLDVEPSKFFAMKTPVIYEVDESGSVDWQMWPGEFEVLLRAHGPLGETWLEAINGLAVKCMTRWNRIPRRILLTESGFNEFRTELNMIGFARLEIEVLQNGAQRLWLGTVVGHVEVSAINIEKE